MRCLMAAEHIIHFRMLSTCWLKSCVVGVSIFGLFFHRCDLCVRVTVRVSMTFLLVDVFFPENEKFNLFISFWKCFLGH